jgi:enamine deaminase RidA (YjgF/YER057c/UK114 family)
VNSIEARLAELGVDLPVISGPLGNYVPFVLAGNLLFISGQGPKDADGYWCRGQLGRELSVEEGYEHARLAALRILAIAEAALGDLDRVHRVIKVLGFVNASSDFYHHSAVIDGCSDLMVDVFGERGRHARTAIGVSGLPEDMSVEIAAVLEMNVVNEVIDIR